MNPIINNLKKLMAEAALSESELGRRTGIGQTVISRLLSGKTANPKIRSLKPLADYFCISVNQLMGDAPLSTDRLPGTFQSDHFGVRHVPLLDVLALQHYLAGESQLAGEKLISCDVMVSEKSYALEVNDATMRPRFPEGTIIILDPQITPEEGDFALVLLSDQTKPLFKQILMDGHDLYLKPLNPDFQTIKISSDYQFLGTLIQARMDFR